MVICEHASTVFYSASTTNDRICLPSSDHFRKIQLASSKHLEFYLELRRKFSATLLFIEVSLLLTGTPTGSTMRNAFNSTNHCYYMPRPMPNYRARNYRKFQSHFAIR